LEKEEEGRERESEGRERERDVHRVRKLNRGV
jgi:hypothetical protein